MKNIFFKINKQQIQNQTYAATQNDHKREIKTETGNRKKYKNPHKKTHATDIHIRHKSSALVL